MTALRVAALALAVLGVIDPPLNLQRAAPVAVEVHGRAVDHVADRLRRALGRTVNFDPDTAPAAIVLVGSTSGSDVAAGTPVSTVALAPPPSPNVRIVTLTEPPPVPVGWKAEVTATLEARGLKNTTSAVVLEQQGTEVARLEHRWTEDLQRIEATLAYAPPVAGTWRLRVRVLPMPAEITAADNAADVRFAASTRRLRILAYEPRPSWAVAFLRRVLEEDQTFDVSALVRASRGLEVRGGQPPQSLTEHALEPFDVVLVGTPEELRPAEVEVLRAFARRRGGAVFLLPDRRPSGPYVSLMPVQGFDELLLDKAVPLATDDRGETLEASEFAVPRLSVAGADEVATVAHGGARRPVILSWPSGSGRILFSGALDAWRFRARENERFSRFWRARVATEALLAPQKLALTLSPGVSRPGDDVLLRVRLRRTEFDERPGRTTMPAIRARLVAADGTEDPIRLWPTAQPGTFEARVKAPGEGQYVVQISEAGVTLADVLLVANDATRPAAYQEPDDEPALGLIARATGGVAVKHDALAPLEQHLRSLATGQMHVTYRPARFAWFMVVFVVLACADWTARRRRGLR
jgi:hypothetical protein